MLDLDLLSAAEPLRQALARGPAAGWESDVPFKPERAGMREAAVLVPIVWRREAPAILLTQRTDSLPTHAGQVSFPGGKRDGADEDLVATALREAREEVGLDPSDVTILGALPRYTTVTGFVVTPVVGLIPPGLDLTPAPGEVASVFELPLSWVMDASRYQRHPYVLDGREGFYLGFHFQAYWVWGATAAMLRMLCATLEALPFQSD
ncbi:CoA pyrophosphatase [Paludibacterium paludis]|uniref:Coenzyme A pyrophosphatase n=1 Tax=Paludibacterium paludis TaxID=1225769 RepID=A0A918P6Q8_9NEIS|nr:CoA pyrophosphatase [Paludibacterium paludis]GGY26561.1 coenzyme A pyrophosphatase [Paludibacterium paludis]